MRGATEPWVTVRKVGIYVQEVRYVAGAWIAHDCRDAGGRATQEQLPRSDHVHRVEPGATVRRVPGGSPVPLQHGDEFRLLANIVKVWVEFEPGHRSGAGRCK